MKHIGFYGGSSIVELGSASEMTYFFSILNEQIHDINDRKILSQFYQKYLHLHELEEASSLITQLRQRLSKEQECRFFKYFEGIEHCIKSAQGFHGDWGIYKPVRIVITDMPDFMTDRDRPLEQYDALSPDDPPFWLR
ncbi:MULTISPECIES: hypothetical protein [Photorhabdus]|uniref:hypothetical protein n=1 Tax=Photorhabdus TaxID=29487 RepID=UPI00223CD6B2|nr:MULTISPECIES: hypothetical protein [Photorhabdus]MCW7547662.1 hypothetical protein [Photorhabdus aballayi]MCW7760691.1 hypothetical protein [Photorhabdus luminescens subsp. venezuelensis]